MGCPGASATTARRGASHQSASLNDHRMNPTTTIMIAALALAIASEASAQSRTYYDKGGNVTGKSATDSQGTTTFYDSRGKVTGRTSGNGSGDTITIYDASGRAVGRATKDR